MEEADPHHQHMRTSTLKELGKYSPLKLFFLKNVKIFSACLLCRQLTLTKHVLSNIYRRPQLPEPNGKLLPYTFTEIHNFVRSQGRVVDTAKTDGHCILHSIVSCLKTDHGLTTSVDILKNVLADHVSENIDYYTNFHGPNFLKDIIQYAVYGKFNTEAGDCVLPILAQAMNLDITVLQKAPDGRIHSLKVTGKDANLGIFVLLKNLHYEPVVKLEKMNRLRNAVTQSGKGSRLDVLASVAEKSAKVQSESEWKKVPGKSVKKASFKPSPPL